MSMREKKKWWRVPDNLPVKYPGYDRPTEERVKLLQIHQAFLDMATRLRVAVNLPTEGAKQLPDNKAWDKVLSKERAIIFTRGIDEILERFDFAENARNAVSQLVMFNNLDANAHVEKYRVLELGDNGNHPTVTVVFYEPLPKDERSHMIRYVDALLRARKRYQGPFKSYAEIDRDIEWFLSVKRRGESVPEVIAKMLVDDTKIKKKGEERIRNNARKALKRIESQLHASFPPETFGTH